ncbi:hypothetical protein C8034_v002095 [Colletotrichum sidae]|uniref:Uncharacterized protein n=1 Tax=Colletotrichum sidae TaxID=1347389 RepID=A0A4R8TCK8_9PEZI|nr:hypothetical protein C8034_v002095 [Colletotrichum sidae]
MSRSETMAVPLPRGRTGLPKQRPRHQVRGGSAGCEMKRTRMEKAKPKGRDPKHRARWNPTGGGPAFLAGAHARHMPLGHGHDNHGPFEGSSCLENLRELQVGIHARLTGLDPEGCRCFNVSGAQIDRNLRNWGWSCGRHGRNEIQGNGTARGVSGANCHDTERRANHSVQGRALCHCLMARGIVVKGSENEEPAAVRTGCPHRPPSSSVSRKMSRPWMIAAAMTKA